MKRFLCEDCIHFRPEESNTFPVCDAFPDGIPLEILIGEVDATASCFGSNGHRFEPRNSNWYDQLETA